VVFGQDKAAGLKEEVESLGGRQVLLLSGKSVAEKTDAVRRVAGILGDRCVGVYSGLTQRAPLGQAAARMIAVMMAEPLGKRRRLCLTLNSLDFSRGGCNCGSRP
jgi:hypothetical protein